MSDDFLALAAYKPEVEPEPTRTTLIVVFRLKSTMI